MLMLLKSSPKGEEFTPARGRYPSSTRLTVFAISAFVRGFINSARIPIACASSSFTIWLNPVHKMIGMPTLTDRIFVASSNPVIPGIV